MGRTSSAAGTSTGLPTSTALGDGTDFGQPVDPFETLPDGGSWTQPIDRAVAPEDLGEAESDLTSDIDEDERRCPAGAEDTSPEAFARMRLAMAFARD